MKKNLITTMNGDNNSPNIDYFTQVHQIQRWISEISMRHVQSKLSPRYCGDLDCILFDLKIYFYSYSPFYIDLISFSIPFEGSVKIIHKNEIIEVSNEENFYQKSQKIIYDNYKDKIKNLTMLKFIK